MLKKLFNKVTKRSQENSLTEKFSELNTIFTKVIESTKEIKDLLREASSWRTFGQIKSNISTFIQLVDELIATGVFAKEALKIEINEDELLDYLAEKLDDIIKLPWLLERIDRFVFRLLLGFAWERVKPLLEGKITVEDGAIRLAQYQLIKNKVDSTIRIG